MKAKIVTYLVLIWFTLQALFMFYWPVYLYYQNGYLFREMLALGVVLLPSSVFIVVSNKIVRKVATCILWVYSIVFAVVGTLANMVASPKPMLALVLTIIMIVNITLLVVNRFQLFIKENNS